jgi:type IV secretion system protein VirB4
MATHKEMQAYVTEHQVPPGQMVIRRAQTSKKVQSKVDSDSHWTAANNARDSLKKSDYFARS